jgi:hypothetical protein
MNESYISKILPFVIFIFCLVSICMTIYYKYIEKNNRSTKVSFLYIDTKLQFISTIMFLFLSIPSILSFFSIKPNRYVALVIVAIVLVSFSYFFKVKNGLTFLLIKSVVLTILLSFIIAFYLLYNSNIIILVISVVLILIYSLTLLKSIIDEVNSLWLHLIALIGIYSFAIACMGIVFGIFYISNNTIFMVSDSTNKSSLIFGVFSFIEFSKESVTFPELVGIWQIGLYHFYQFTNISVTSFDYRICIPFIEYIIGTVFNIGIIGFFMSYTSSKAYENSCNKKSEERVPICENDCQNAELVELIQTKLDKHCGILENIKEQNNHNSDILKNSINPTMIQSIVSDEINKLKEHMMPKLEDKIPKSNELNKSLEKLYKHIAEIRNKQKLFFNANNKFRTDFKIFTEHIERIEVANKSFLIRLEKLNSLINETKKMNEEIMNITNQTKAVSLNASIQANHAGNVGKGFGIVAQEMKKLAADSNRITSNANKLLSNLGDEIKAFRDLQSSIAKDIQIDENINQLNLFLRDINEIEATSSIIENIIDDINEIISKEGES